MQQPPKQHGPSGAPTFHLIDRKPPRPAAVFLAILLAATVLTGVAYGLGHTKQLRPTNDPLGATRTPGGDPITPREKEEEKDDPNQVDTIVVGDAADAPRPA